MERARPSSVIEGCTGGFAPPAAVSRVENFGFVFQLARRTGMNLRNDLRAISVP